MTLRDDHVPGNKWEFNTDVASKFDDMLERSIPHYNAMRDLVHMIGSKYVTDTHIVVDLGASRGESSNTLIQNFPATDFLLLEVSEPMLKELHQRFSDTPNVSVDSFDLRQNTKELQAYFTKYVKEPSLFLSILTMIFVPINFRPSILQAIYNSLPSGGAFIMVEKVLGDSALLQELLVDVYHDYKHRNGYSWEDIERKRMALEGVQVPVSSQTNIDMLKSAGFTDVATFWQHMNFVGFIAVKR